MPVEVVLVVDVTRSVFPIKTHRRRERNHDKMSNDLDLVPLGAEGLQFLFFSSSHCFTKECAVSYTGQQTTGGK